ncbi:MAG: lipopolysaccharide transport periplasmic protein LptA [Ferrovum sp. 37-45-19]|uniref:lipopolysaccharide transport periplasmic protein LptA n=1 Tax=Ferrovum sp. JA12 TaxID=1356299 RepID=UPI000702F83D|nr:lipopolysaccharide transport periplasmic protein LptA [Ferrovum sp. JA12]OYV79607.1 MAG: lipopolysaccharide transport periplasmic protein LptA [Ferrovum sp. 21-44-67]OYV94598.1 MAG: lipopolysaccharide transport periplasmic protein LptA [Ferrovum sp. 37-45-19]OZB34575.1 MAG: lipopolysaccharide transport periplasmic protein LptA [Ferrovum sp. 34-44-207]HQT81532.1 lipopolysaccharide transport periplasmic protein LptA [Ferrovaceae bacterium]KRH79504.1 lipopolysaccharide export system protein Lp
MLKPLTTQKNHIKIFIIFLLVTSLSAKADKADKDKPINIESDKMTADDIKKISYFDGNVVMTQGTIRLTGEHIIVSEDKTGFKHATAFGDPVTFRQKKEASDQWVDGIAKHVEYDEKIGRVELFNKAIVRQGKDEIKGNYLSYDLNTEFLQAEGKDKNNIKTPKGRVHMIFKPEDNKAPATGKPSTFTPTLKTDGATTP